MHIGGKRLVLEYESGRSNGSTWRGDAAGMCEAVGHGQRANEGLGHGREMAWAPVRCQLLSDWLTSLTPGTHDVQRNVPWGMSP
jgi:hypothetical protein